MPVRSPARVRVPKNVRVSSPAAAAVALQAAPVPETLRPSFAKATEGLRHLAIIPDGNRRWAKQQGLPVWDGVRQGVKTAEAIFEAIRRRGIPWCTFWAASYDNLRDRPAPERAVLNELFQGWFSRLAENETVRRERVRVRVIGEWAELLAAGAVSAIRRVLATTEAHGGPALTFLVGYDGDRELVAAVRELLQQRESGKARNAPRAAGLFGAGERERAPTIDDLRRKAWTTALPAVDLIVRTGSWEDPHRSANFLPLLTSNVQEAYPEVYWPAFSETELDAVIADFGRRERRKGR